MRKLLVSSAAVAAMLVFAAVAYAANVYEVTPAATTPGGAGTPAKPKPKAIKFGFTAAGDNGTRAEAIKRYSINFQGLKSFAGKFPKCTYAQANMTQVSPACAKAKVGSGLVNNQFGAASNPNQKDRCDLKLVLYNTGKGFAIRLDGGPAAGTECPLAVNQALNGKLIPTRIGGKPSVSLRFDVTRNLYDPLQNGSIDNAVAKVQSTVSKKTRKTTIKGERRNVSILSSVACAGSRRTISVTFTDTSNQAVTESKKIKC